MAALRVLYSFPHALGRPGIGTTAYHQVVSLCELGCTVTVYCASLARPLPPSARVVTTMAVAGRRVPQRMVGVDRSYSFHDRRVAHEVRAHPDRYDVVHTWPLGAEATLRSARGAGVPGLREVPNTHTAHAMAVVAAELDRLGLTPPAGHSHTVSPARLRREHAEYAAATGLLVPSDAVARTFLERGVAPEQLLRHRYGYDPDRFLPQERVEGGAFTAVFAGRCEPRKGLHHALQAWRQSGAGDRGGRLLVCGGFDPDYERLLMGDLALPGVEVVGFSDRLGALMATADVLVLPSLEEGSALVTYEAMASGLVPLVSTATGAPVRADYDALVHEPGDVAALAEHLTLASTDPARLAVLRRNVLDSARDLTWRQSGRRLMDCYARSVSHNQAVGHATLATRPEEAR
jgi:glycosyltransferase involved in cell wall biosynthesis